MNSGSLAGSNLVASIEAGAPALSGQITPNALPCQCEQFNALASLVGSQPQAKVDVSTFGNSGVLTDGANYFPIYATARDNNALSVSPEFGQLVWPRTAFYCWQTPASGPDPVATYLTGLGATVQTTAVFGTGSSGGISWISIDDARTIYANFSMAFTLDVTAYPVSWVADATIAQGGSFVNDPNGNFLQVGYAWDGHTNNNYTMLAVAGSPANDTTRSLLDWAQGIMQPTSPGSTYPPPSVAGTHLAIQREGLCDLCVRAIPLNYAYQEPDAVPAAALQALGGSIIPVFADNTVEAADGEFKIIPGAGGAGAYDHIITTGLQNAHIQTTPIDGVIYPPAPSAGL